MTTYTRNNQVKTFRNPVILIEIESTDLLGGYDGQVLLRTFRLRASSRDKH